MMKSLKKTIKTKVEYTTELKILGGSIAQKNLFIYRKGYYFLQSKLQNKLDFKTIDRFLNADYQSLAEYDEDLKSIIVLKWDLKTKNSTCFCMNGFIYGICQHKAALEIFMKALTKPVILIANNKRGRKRKATSALNPQDLSPLKGTRKKNNFQLT